MFNVIMSFSLLFVWLSEKRERKRERERERERERIKAIDKSFFFGSTTSLPPGLKMNEKKSCPILYSPLHFLNC